MSDQPAKGTAADAKERVRAVQEVTNLTIDHLRKSGQQPTSREMEAYARELGRRNDRQDSERRRR